MKSTLVNVASDVQRAGVPGLRALSLHSVTAPTPIPHPNLPQGPRMSQDVPPTAGHGLHESSQLKTHSPECRSMLIIKLITNDSDTNT